MIDRLNQHVASPLGELIALPWTTGTLPHGVLNDDLMHPNYWVKNEQRPLGPVPAMRIGVVFSGGPAPGGHDVIVGLLRHLRSGDEVIGFCNGFGGLLRSEYRAILPTDAHALTGLGGFDFLGTDRTKLSTDAHFETAKQVIQNLKLSALVVVGGDDSNTNALFLAKALHGVCQVIGVPKTIDGDLAYPPYLTVTFGFHTATQHYADLVSMLAIDARATRKYVHVVKLMGRSASHVALEVARQVAPNGCILAEEIAEKKWGLMDVLDYFSGVIMNRLAVNKPYGVLIFPEGMLEAIPEFKSFLKGDSQPLHRVFDRIGVPLMELPGVVLDAHGNPNMSLIRSEELLVSAITAVLTNTHNFKNDVQLLGHFFGYTGRAAAPTPFDSAYSQLLGKTAYESALMGLSGVLVGCDFSTNGPVPLALPLVGMVHFDSHRERYVIQKYMVDTQGEDYQSYLNQKQQWVLNDATIPRPNSSKWPKQLQLKITGA